VGCRMRTILILLTFLLFLFGCGTGNVVNGNLVDGEPVRIGYLELSAFLPDFIVLENGFLEDEGLVAEYIEYGDGNTLLNDVVLGRIDKAFIGVTSYLPIEEQSPGAFQIFYPAFENLNHSGSCLMVNVDSNVTDISELKGKSFGTYIGTTQKLSLTLIFKNVFGSKDAAEIIQVDKLLQLQGLVDEQFDALLTIEPFCSIGVSQGMAKILEKAPRAKYIMNPYPVGAGFFSSDFVERRPADADKVVRAFDRALKIIKENEFEAKKLLPKYTKLTEEIAPYTQFYVLGESSDLTYEFREKTQEMANILYEENILDTKVDTSNIYYQSPSAVHEVVIGYRGHGQYLPVFVAKEQGYFEDEGLSAELVMFESTNTMIEAILAERVHASFGGVNTLALFYLQQQHSDAVKIFGLAKGDEDHFLQRILVKADSDMNNILDLEGKTLGIYLGSGVKVIVEELMSTENVFFEYIQMAPSLLVDALESGSVDAILVLEPMGTYAIQKGIAKALVDAVYVTYFTDLVSGSVMSSDLVTDDLLLADKLVRIQDRAAKFINDNPEIAAQYLIEYANVDSEMVEHLMIVPFLGSDDLDSTSVQHYADKMFEAGHLDSRINVSGLFY